MNKRLIASCIDINTPYCPCLLAETNHCVFCAHLKGQPVCDCNWGGVCILYEKLWQSKGGTGSNVVSRKEEICRVVRMSPVSEGTVLIELAVSKGLADELKRTGAFVFVRRPEDPSYYHLPVGVMKVVGEHIHLVVDAVGPKSVRLLDGGPETLLVRGPYYNGVLGQPWIDHITCGKILLMAGGIGQPPAVPLAAKLTANKNRVTAIIAPGRIGTVFIEEELRELGATIYIVDSLRRSGLGLLANLLQDPVERPDLIVSAGPDDQHYGIIGAMRAVNVNIPLAVTNNATMCCGEGVCGSCDCETQEGKTIRLCKVQTEFSRLLS